MWDDEFWEGRAFSNGEESSSGVGYFRFAFISWRRGRKDVFSMFPDAVAEAHERVWSSDDEIGMSILSQLSRTGWPLPPHQRIAVTSSFIGDRGVLED